VYLGPYGSPESKARYEAAVNEWLARGRQAPEPKVKPDAGPTIAQVLIPYLEHADRYYRRDDGSPTGESENVRLAFRELSAMYANLPAKDFGSAQLKAIRQRLIGEPSSETKTGKKRYLTREGINRRIAYIVAAFRWAAEEKMVPASVWHELKCIKPLQRSRSDARETTEVPPVPMEIVEATIPHMSRHLAAMVHLQLLCGCRPGELCEMRACDIDMTGPIWVYRPRQHKEKWRGKPRNIYLETDAQAIVRAFLKADDTAPLFSPADAEAEYRTEKRRQRKTPLWPSHLKAQARKRKRSPRRRPRDAYTNKSYHHAVARACDRAFLHPTLSKIKRKDLAEEQRIELEEWRKAHRWHPHQLRHTAGTEKRRQHGLDFAQVFLGHARASTTEIYAKADEAKALEIMVAKLG
jgi:integrase